VKRISHFSLFLCAMTLFCCMGVQTSTSSAQILINEYVSSNTLGLLDEFGETPDWFEVYNNSGEIINLYHYGVSDDPDDPFQWYFPSTLIQPGGFALVFASGESRRDTPYFWEAFVTRGDSWRYHTNTTAPAEGWQDPAFDDSSWMEGISGFGYGDGDDQTLLDPCLSTSFRISFTVEDLALVRFLLFHIDYDDGYAAWLNGSPISRGNMTGTDDPPWDCPADDEREATLYRGGSLSGGSISSGAMIEGVNVLAVQVHNESLESDDLTCIPYLTGGLRVFDGPGGRSPAPEVVARLVQMHTNFKLSVEGETLTLVDPDGVVLDQVDTGVMYSDISRGRYPDGTETWNFFTTPSPRTSNAEGGSAAFSQQPVFSNAGELLSAPIFLSISSNDSADTIRYTTDGTIPGPEATLYSEPLDISETTVLRAVNFSAGMLPSRPSTASFILDEPSALPTVSFVTDPYNLFDQDYGIYHEDNIFESWERPVHLEFFDDDGIQVLNQDAGVKLFGAYSRTMPQKSFRLISRSGYGLENFSHPILPEKDLSIFSQVIWRNAGNDFANTHLRDGLMHRLVAELDLDRLAYRPCRTYINGQYWGIMNLRERMDEDYIAANNAVPADGIDMIKNFWTTIVGHSTDFWAMWHYIEDNDLTDDLHFDHVAGEMDVDNYTSYVVTEVFAGNHDWGTNNIAWWKPQAEGGKWRWILYDTEAGLGLQTSVEDNSLERALLESGSGWPSPTFRTHILRNLVKNESFKISFINRFCDLLNTTFEPQRTIPMSEVIAANIAPEIPRHFDRWDRTHSWESRIEVVQDFLTRRPGFCRQFMQQQFSLGEEVNISLSVQPVGAGNIQLNSVSIDSAFSGTYFADVPVQLIVQPAFGYTFAGWSDTTMASADSLMITLGEDRVLTATFAVNDLVPHVVINEINYYSHPAFDSGDWVELHNPGLEELDISGWIFRDGSDLHGYTIPEGTILGPEGYLVLCSDLGTFFNQHPQVESTLGDLGFGFSGAGELLRIYDNYGALHDSLTYDDAAPWPLEADGLGATLMLSNPFLDNALPSSWVAGLGGGTPGAPNTLSTNAPSAVNITRFETPHPNPFNPRTEISFYLAQNQRVELGVYDLRGHRVKVLTGGNLIAGHHQRIWDGTDQSGREMPSGTYVFLLKLENSTLTQKALLLR
jgi:hypothetical protein